MALGSVTPVEFVRSFDASLAPVAATVGAVLLISFSLGSAVISAIGCFACFDMMEIFVKMDFQKLDF